MALIDKDQLKAEIERLKSKYRHNGLWTSSFQSDLAMAKIESMNELLSFLDSLPEQPDFPTTNEHVKEFLATHPKVEVPKKYKTPYWLWKKQERPVEGLDSEITRYLRDECSSDDELSVSEVARHFAEWGAEHLKR